MPQFKRYFSGTTVSRDSQPGDYSWDMVVVQSGRPILDVDLNLPQVAAEYNRVLTATRSVPSGFLRAPSVIDAFSDFVFPSATTPNANLLGLTRQLATVAGMPVVVDLTAASSQNTITLPAPTAHSGPGDARRTDFIFLEVWRAVVSPSPRAYGTIAINTPQTILDTETVSIDATAVGGPLVVFTCRAAPAGITDFQLGGDSLATATALAARINDPANGLYPTYVAARTNGTNTVTVTATFGGVTGNGIALTTSAPTHVTLSAPTLLNGANRGNKPTQSTIYRHGNVLSLTADALDDNMVDPILNSETTQRVQVQYRLRVFSGVNAKTQPDGFTEATLLAQGTQGAPVAGYKFVPADKTTISIITGKTSSAEAYGFEDPGLWIAGDGTSTAATDLGTADGFVYAIPVAMVFRRNDTTLTGGFDPYNNAQGALPIGHVNNFSNTNLPGGPYAIPTAKSDRPDGLFADIIVSQDVLDLRRHVSEVGWDFVAELKSQLQALLDKRNSTWQVSASDLSMVGNGTGGDSTYPMVCNAIGREGANGGSAPTSGDTTVGTTIRNFDHIARRFGSQSVVERMVFEVFPVVASNPTGITVVKSLGVTWHEEDTISLDLSTLNPTTRQNWGTAAVPGVGVTAFWPSGTLVTDVLSVYHDDGHDTSPVNQQVQLRSVEGIGTPLIKLTLDVNQVTVNGGGAVADHPMIGEGVTDGGSPRRIFVELEITYPTGFGLTRTPDLATTPTSGSGYPGYDRGGAIIENDLSQRPTEMDTNWVPKPMFRDGFREVALEQRSAPSGTFITDNLVTLDGNHVRTPRRVATTTSLTANAGAATAAYGSSTRLVTLTGAPVSNQTLVAVTYYSQDPVPNAGASGYQVGVYYRTRAPQTAGVQSGAIPTTLLPTELSLEPLAIADNLWTGTMGKGASELGFPYTSPLDAIAMAGTPVGTVPKEWHFSGTADISVADFNSPTGLLNLHNFVQMDGSSLTLGSTTLGRGTQKDAEFRAYYDYVNYGGYKPTVMAQPLSGQARHKVFTAMLARATVDSRLYRRGEVLLVVFSRYASLDGKNSVAFTDSPAIRTAAAVYRTRNLLLTSSPMVV